MIEVTSGFGKKLLPDVAFNCDVLKTDSLKK
jgi:hypothetical protein